MNNHVMIQQMDQGWIKTASELYEIQQQRKELQELESVLKADLVRMSHHKTAIGGKFVFSLSFRKGSINYKAIPELKNIDLETYRGEKVETWKLQEL